MKLEWKKGFSNCLNMTWIDSWYGYEKNKNEKPIMSFQFKRYFNGRKTLEVFRLSNGVETKVLKKDVKSFNYFDFKSLAENHC